MKHIRGVSFAHRECSEQFIDPLWCAVHGISSANLYTRYGVQCMGLAVPTSANSYPAFNGELFEFE